MKNDRSRLTSRKLQQNRTIKQKTKERHKPLLLLEVITIIHGVCSLSLVSAFRLQVCLYGVMWYKLFCNFVFTCRIFWSVLLHIELPRVYYMLVVIPESEYI